MGKHVKNNTEGSGGEFLVAIRAAEECSNCQRLVLGDRSSLTTIRRAATLALQSGDPLGVINRLQKANGEEMKELALDTFLIFLRHHLAELVVDTLSVYEIF